MRFAPNLITVFLGITRLSPIQKQCVDRHNRLLLDNLEEIGIIKGFCYIEILHSFSIMGPLLLPSHEPNRTKHRSKNRRRPLQIVVNDVNLVRLGRQLYIRTYSLSSWHDCWVEVY